MTANRFMYAAVLNFDRNMSNELIFVLIRILINGGLAKMPPERKRFKQTTISNAFFKKRENNAVVVANDDTKQPNELTGLLNAFSLFFLY